MTLICKTSTDRTLCEIPKPLSGVSLTPEKYFTQSGSDGMIQVVGKPQNSETPVLKPLLVYACETGQGLNCIVQGILTRGSI